MIIFFDGNCALCNRFVCFLLKHDKKKMLLFAPLQGKTIQQTKAYNIKDRESVIFLKGELLFIKSEAILEVLASLDGIWKIVKILKSIPRWIRDFFYDVIAKKRYAWFGNASCRIMTKEEKGRFLE
jgi:predicted DCC family thiol-disulfide oxidoreductase YuxK